MKLSMLKTTVTKVSGIIMAILMIGVLGWLIMKWNKSTEDKIKIETFTTEMSEGFHQDTVETFIKPVYNCATNVIQHSEFANVEDILYNLEFLNFTGKRIDPIKITSLTNGRIKDGPRETNFRVAKIHNRPKFDRDWEI